MVLCENCLKSIQHGFVIFGHILCKTCSQEITYCPKCKLNSMINKCLNCGHMSKKFECDICHKIDANVVVMKGTIYCTNKCYKEYENLIR